MSTIYETKYYLLFGIIHLFTASSTVKTPKHTYAEDYCVGSEITKLPRKIMQTKLSNNLKIILILDGHNSKIYGPLMKIKTVFMNMRSIILIRCERTITQLSWWKKSQRILCLPYWEKNLYFLQNKLNRSIYIYRKKYNCLTVLKNKSCLLVPTIMWNISW